MKENILRISKKNREKGDDGHRVFSVRIKVETVTAIDDVSVKTNRSRNEFINMFLEFALENSEVDTYNALNRNILENQ